MIYIDTSLNNVSIYIEKHYSPDNSVNFRLIRSIDSSTVIDSSAIEENGNYYSYNLDCSVLKAGQYEFQIVDNSTNIIHESGLLYKQADSSTQNQNITITYERQ